MSTALMQRFGGTCFPDLYVDGMAVRLGAEPGERAFNDVVPPPEQIEAIEVYPGGATIPPQWRGATSSCDVIVVWTKH